MANDVFSRADTFLNGFLTTLEKQVQTLLSNEIGTLIVSSIILYIIIYGYMVLAGKIQTPIADLLWNLARLGIIVAFVRNEGGILTHFSEAVKELSTLGGNGKTVLANFDTLLATVSEFSERLVDQVDWFSEGFISVLVFVGFAFLAIPISLTYILSKITLHFLLALSPIFFFMLMWGWLKDSFARFVSLLISNALALVIINVLISLSIKAVEAQTKMNGNPWLVAFSFIAMGVITGMAIKYVVSVVNTVISVSVERAGAGAVGAYKGAKNFIQSATTPTANSIAQANMRTAKSQEQTQKDLQGLISNMKESLPTQPKK